MKIAVTAESNNGLESMVAQHFGHAPFFILVDVENGEVTATQGVANPFVKATNPVKFPTSSKNKTGRNIKRRHGWARNPIF